MRYIILVCITMSISGIINTAETNTTQLEPNFDQYPDQPNPTFDMGKDAEYITRIHEINRVQRFLTLWGAGYYYNILSEKEQKNINAEYKNNKHLPAIHNFSRISQQEGRAIIRDLGGSPVMIDKMAEKQNRTYEKGENKSELTMILNNEI